VTVVRNEQVFPTVIVVIADADALSPAGGGQPGFCGHVSERAVVVIVKQEICWLLAFGKALECGAIHDKNIRPPIIVVIEDRDTTTRGFDDVLFCDLAAKRDRHRDAGFSREINELSGRRLSLGRCRGWIYDER